MFILGVFGRPREAKSRKVGKSAEAELSGEGEREEQQGIAMATVAMEMRETEMKEADTEKLESQGAGGICNNDPLGPPTNPMVSALLTDMYQLSMAYAYWKAGKHNDRAVYVSSHSCNSPSPCVLRFTSFPF